MMKYYIVLLLHRMSHLEELFLNVCIERNILDDSFIDGNNLKNNISPMIATCTPFLIKSSNQVLFQLVDFVLRN